MRMVLFIRLQDVVVLEWSSEITMAASELGLAIFPPTLLMPKVP
jgi:hypothetical protein